MISRHRIALTAYSAVTLLLVALFSVAFVFTQSNSAYAQGSQLIVMTADWCANCRTIIPIVKETAQTKGMSVVLVDVDQPSAPKDAKRFGIPILSRELPQVFLVTPSSTRMILEGSDYTYGDDELVRDDLMDALAL